MAAQGSSGFDEDAASRAKLINISKCRGGHASNVRRKHKDFQLAVDEKLDVQSIKNKLTSLETAVGSYKETHAECVQLALHIDRDKLPELEEDFNEMEEILKQARYQCTALYPDQQDDIAPNDSASQCDASVIAESTISSARARAAAKRASLLVKAKFLKQQQELDLIHLRNKNPDGGRDAQTKGCARKYAPPLSIWAPLNFGPRSAVGKKSHFCFVLLSSNYRCYRCTVQLIYNLMYTSCRICCRDSSLRNRTYLVTRTARSKQLRSI